MGREGNGREGKGRIRKDREMRKDRETYRRIENGQEG